MFWRKKEPDAVVTNASFARWLRAHKPPFTWFMSRTEVEQEQLALLGDDYVRDVLVCLGNAVADPRGFAAGAAALAGDEVEIARQVANGLLAKIAQPKPKAAPPVVPAAAPVSMAGVGRRRSFLGRTTT